MPATAPTILATSAGFRPHRRLRFGFGPMMTFAVELGHERGPRADGPPRLCNIGTASGDDKGFQRDLEEAAREVSEDGRRPLLRALVADGTLGTALCTDDGAGLLFRGAELVEAVAEIDGVRVTRIECGADGPAVETDLPVRRLR